MTITIELPDSLEEPLKAHAQSKGVSTAGYVCLAVQHAISEDDKRPDPEQRETRPIWEVITDRMKNLPDRVFDQLPKDGASQLDHYIYGLPKRNP